MYWRYPLKNSGEETRFFGKNLVSIHWTLDNPHVAKSAKRRKNIVKTVQKCLFPWVAAMRINYSVVWEYPLLLKPPNSLPSIFKPHEPHI